MSQSEGRGSGGRSASGWLRVAGLLALSVSLVAAPVWAAEEKKPAENDATKSEKGTQDKPLEPGLATIWFRERVNEAGERALDVQMPPGLPMNRPFVLRSYIPNDVKGVTASYWRTYERAGCDRKGNEKEDEPSSPLATQLREPKDDEEKRWTSSHSQVLEIFVPELTEPWWDYCFDIKFWTPVTRESLSPMQFDKLVQALNRAEEDGAVSASEIEAAGMASGVLANCNARGEWDQRIACERIHKKATDDLQSTVGKVVTARIDMRGKATSFELNALALKPSKDWKSTLPSYTVLSLLYGTTRLSGTQYLTQAQATEDLSARRKSLDSEIKNLQQLKILGNTLPVAGPERIEALFKALSNAQTTEAENKAFVKSVLEECAEAEARVVAEQKAAREALFQALEVEIEQLEKDAAQTAADARKSLPELNAQVVQAKAVVEAQQALFKSVEANDRTALFQLVDKRSKEKVQRSARVEQLTAGLQAAKDAVPQNEEEIAELEKRLGREKEALLELTAEKLQEELNQRIQALSQNSRTLLPNLWAAEQALARAELAFSTKQAMISANEAKAQRCGPFLTELRALKAQAGTYEQAMSDARQKLGLMQIIIAKSIGAAKGRKAVRQTERAEGFFTTDVGLGAMFGRGSFDVAPLTFIQVSMSFAHLDLNKGLGFASPPKGKWSDKAKWTLGQRLSLGLGVSISTPNVRTTDGQLLGILGSPVLGSLTVGYRVTDFLKLNMGGAFGTTRSALPGNNLQVQPYFFAGASLDLPVYQWVARSIQPAMPAGFSLYEIKKAVEQVKGGAGSGNGAAAGTGQ